jgi:thioredoxin-like negative regulator of GroEL
MRLRQTIPWLLVLSFAPGTSHFALGQEIDWRSDYNKARQEASETGRPLLLDFGTESCYWCKQLDARTFKDPAIAALVNERYIPLKVDASRNRALADALRVQSYPTLVLASPDGRILGYQEGFVEAGKLKDQLQRTLATVSAPDWMSRDYDEAVKAHTEGKHARTVSLLKGVVEDGKDRPIQGKARQLLETVEQEATAQLARARKLAEGGQTDAARAAVEELSRNYAGTLAAREGEQWLATVTRKSEPPGDPQRVRRAKDLLAQAREDFRMQQFLCCLDRCETLLTTYSDLAEAAEAGQLATEIKANPEWARQAADQTGERLCLLYLTLADSALKKGQPQQAVQYLEKVTQMFPNSRHAETASARLAQIQGQPRK